MAYFLRCIYFCDGLALFAEKAYIVIERKISFLKIPVDSMKKTILFLLIIFGLLGSGCVYYNTFFLARKNYRLAEQKRLRSTSDELPSEAKSYYDVTITKSSKVLAFYPETKWVDDALFLLGMCFYRTGEYTKAIRKFDELTEAFPESEYGAEAHYWRTLCIYEVGEFDAALERLKELSSEGIYAERSTFMMAELFYEQGDFISAKEAYLSYLTAYPGGEFESLAHLRLANIAFSFEKYGRCIEEARQISESRLTPAEFFSSRMLIGEALTELDSLKEALGHYVELRKNDDFFTRWPEVDLRIGDVHYLMTDTTSAIDIWSDVCLDNPRTENSAWGWYKRGDLHLDFGAITVAKTEFDSAAAQIKSGEVYELALQKSSSIARLQEFKSIFANQSDSVEVDVVGTELALAEMYLLELGQPDSALSQYNFILENYPEDSLAPKAAYGIGYVYAYSMNDRQMADSAFAELLSNYPESDFAVGGADYFVGRGAALDSLGVRTVAYYFVRAEEFLLTYRRIDSALATYRFVSDSFPNSIFRPKAIAARAYIHETITFNYPVAESLYRFLSDSFPKTEFSQRADVRLGKAAPDIETEKPPEYADASPLDTLSDEEFERIDSLKRSMDNERRRGRGQIIDPVTGKPLPRAPRPKRPVELRYPQAEWKSDLNGRRVRLKIRIDAFGEVKETELMATCGNDIIDQAAISGTKAAKWEPEDIPIEHIGGWFYFEVVVTKPKETIDSF